MAIFTFDDLNEMENLESEFFGPKGDNCSEEFAPSAESLSLISNYSKSLSVRNSRLVGMIRFHIN